MFESGLSASFVTRPTGELLVGETLRRAVGSPTGLDTAAVLVAIAAVVRTEAERALLADGWAKVAAWVAGQAADARGESAGLSVAAQAGLGRTAPAPRETAPASPAAGSAPRVVGGRAASAPVSPPASASPGFVPVAFPGVPGEVRAQAFAEHASAAESIERACTSPAGPEQVAALARIEPSLVAEDGPALTGLIEGYERQISWLTARKLAVVAEKHDATARAMREHPDFLHERWTRDGIAAGLHVAPATAAGWVWFARRLKVDFPGIRTALTAGDLTVQQAKAILEELPSGWDEATRADAETRLVEAGRRLPPARLRDNARALVIALDPEGAARRRREAEQAQAGVDYRTLADGLGQLTVIGSAVDTQRIWHAIDSTARARRARRRVTEEDGCGCPDNPTLGQDRVTALMELATGTGPSYGSGGDVTQCAPSRPGQPDVPDAGADAGVTVGEGEHVADTEPQNGPDHGGGAAADRSIAADGDTGYGGAPTAGSDPAEHDNRSGNGDPTVGGRAAAVDSAGIRLPGGPRTQVHVVIDLPTLLGLADNPAVLQGYGPIDPDLARQLATDGDWLRWVTDPVTGHLLDDGDRRFPGARLRRFIKARDPVCVVPGCHQPSRVADVDHVNGGYRAAQRTAAATLVAACVGHNRTRDDAGWTATMHPDTSIEWTTTLGETHVVPPRRVLPDTPPAVPPVSIDELEPPF